MSRSILVVDDQKMFRESMSDALRLRGYAVREAESVPAALADVAQFPPDLALVDICMPDYDGIDFLRLLNGRPGKAKVPVILMTAQPRREYLEAAASLGICDFVVKSSFSVQELILRIEMRLRSEGATRRPSARAEEIGGPTEGARQRQESLNADRPGEVFRPGVDAPLYARSSLGPISTDGDLSGARSSLGSISTVGVLSGGRSGRGPISTSGPISSADMREEAALHRRKIAGRVRQFRGLEARALPRPISEILALSSSMIASLVQLETVVRRDPILSARILSLANSAAHRGSTLVGHLEEALRNLGLDAVVDMVGGVPCVTAEDLQGEPGRELSALWWHSLATAVFCDRLAPLPVRPGAYLVGLLHDLPLLFGLQALGEEWGEVRGEPGRSGLAMAERIAEAFGMAPAQLAREVCSRYRLPETIGGPLREYHGTILAGGVREAGETAQRVDVAHNFAVALGWDWKEQAQVRCVTKLEARGWREGERLVLELPHLAREIQELGRAAGLPETGDSARWDLEGGVLYWRAPEWAVPDPLEHVLSRFRGFESCETIEQLLAAEGTRKVAAVDPGYEGWAKAVGGEAEVLVVHRAGVGSLQPPKGVRLLQMPVEVSRLREALAGGGEPRLS